MIVAEDFFNFDTTCVIGAIAPLVSCKFEPVGRWYEVSLRRRLRQHTLSNSSAHTSESESDDSDANYDDDDEEFLRGLDPRSWKDQDHYKVLGLSKIRWKATPRNIKNAYRRQVLLHHPDKRKGHGKEIKADDDYFTCITKAYDVLGSSTKRRAYDSVDPEFDDLVPSVLGENKDGFYDRFGPVFARNARWSKQNNVPSLGTKESTREEVDRFYDFWYSFESWREYSYLDEEEKEKGTDRYERRMIDQENKRLQKERKKEETARIRQLVDNAYASDPRIQYFKQEEKDQKAAIKRARQEAAKARQEEEERQRLEAELEAKRKLEEVERISREQAAAAKKERELARNAIKKERKQLRTRAKELNYFAQDETSRVKNLTDVDRLAEALSVASLRTLNERLKGDTESSTQAFYAEVKALNEQMERERVEQLSAGSKASDTSVNSSAKGKAWSPEENQLLIKAVNMFPAGTINRWEVVAEFLTQHLPSSNRSAKDVLSQAKTLQKMDSEQRKLVNQTAFDRTMQAVSSKVTAVAAKQDDPSQRYMSPGEAIVVETGENPLPWSAEEQKLLEQALRSYPNGTPDRWDKIAGCLPTRSKKDCMLRFKELAELIKAKKAAETSVAAKKK